LWPPPIYCGSGLARDEGGAVLRKNKYPTSGCYKDIPKKPKTLQALAHAGLELLGMSDCHHLQSGKTGKERRFVVELTFC